MSVLEAIVLGIVQGLTEFLPISSAFQPTTLGVTHRTAMQVILDDDAVSASSTVEPFGQSAVGTFTLR